ncbi:MAG: hypothetical protein ACYSW7_04210 [Planctomycetota bacterium]|jgi:hypothetical protein
MNHSNALINRRLIDTANLFRYALAASYYTVAGDVAVKRKHAIVIVARKNLSGKLSHRERLVPKSLLSIKDRHTAERFPEIRWIAEYWKHFRGFFF